MAIHVLLYSTNIMTSKIVTVLTDLIRTLQKGMSCCLSESCYKHVVKPKDLIKKIHYKIDAEKTRGRLFKASLA